MKGECKYSSQKFDLLHLILEIKSKLEIERRTSKALIDSMLVLNSHTRGIALVNRPKKVKEYRDLTGDD